MVTAALHVLRAFSQMLQEAVDVFLYAAQSQVSLSHLLFWFFQYLFPFSYHYQF